MFGSGIGDLLRRAKEAREKQEREQVPMCWLVLIPHLTLTNNYDSTPPPSALVSPTPPLSPAAKARKIRFAQLTPDNMHVYPSAPLSPKRKALALMPLAVGEEGVISLGEYKSHATNNHSDIVEGHGREDMLTFVAKKVGEEPEEGSPEYIRRKYFPSTPADDRLSRGSPLHPSPPPLPIPHRSALT